jgi:hypothetical protein
MTVEEAAEVSLEEKLNLVNVKADKLREELNYTYAPAKLALLKAEFEAAKAEIVKLKKKMRSERRKQMQEKPKREGKDEVKE